MWLVRPGKTRRPPAILTIAELHEIRTLNVYLLCEPSHTHRHIGSCVGHRQGHGDTVVYSYATNPM